MFLEEEICMLANIHVKGLSGFYNSDSQVYYKKKYLDPFNNLIIKGTGYQIKRYINKYIQNKNKKLYVHMKC